MADNKTEAANTHVTFPTGFEIDSDGVQHPLSDDARRRYAALLERSMQPTTRKLPMPSCYPGGPLVV
jgi:hypothetical protein